MNKYLNHDWLFLDHFEDSFIAKAPKDAETVEIPHSVKLFPIQYLCERDYQGDYYYGKVFDLPDDLPVVFLVIEGAMLQFDAYLNGESLGHFVSGYFPVRIDISKVVKKKGNYFAMHLSSKEDPSIPPFGKVVDYLTFAGLYRKVRIETHPSDYIEDIYAYGEADGSLHVEALSQGEGTPTFELYDGEELIKSFQENDVIIPNVHPYSIEDPHLYTLVAKLGEDSKTIRIGFRSSAFTDKGYFLNGKRVPLIGLNRHQTYPYFGAAAPDSLQKEDADLLKKFGCNVVRTSHYADDESFLDRCDEIGLLVINEIPGWQYIGKDDAWRNQCYDFARRLILKERNHPSLILYGLRIDESDDDHELYSKIREIHQELDPHRQSTGVRNFKDSELLEDVYSYNDFCQMDVEHGLDASESWGGAKGKPKFVSESNGHMFPTKAFDTTKRREEHALRHAKVLNDLLGDEGLSGSTSWCAFDYNTHREFGNCDHICHHGVFDIFRNPKYAAYAYACMQENEPVLEACSLMQTGDNDESLMPSFYCFTNCDYIALLKNGIHVNDFYPDKKNYPNLPHPPILIDDWIGDLFDEPNFTEKDRKRMMESLNYCGQKGFARLRLKDKFIMFRCMNKYHLSFTDVVNAYNKYINSWGSKETVWTLVGYKGGEAVIQKVFGASSSTHYEATASRTTLVHGDVFDCVSVHLLKKDEYGTRSYFANDPISLSVTGPIEVYGPSLISLYAGGSTIYVRSKKGKGPQEATLTIRGLDADIVLYFLVK